MRCQRSPLTSITLENCPSGTPTSPSRDRECPRLETEGRDMIRRAVVFLCALGFACGSNPSGPTTAAISASPSGVALAGATRITFTGSGVDPQGGALSYSWSFGDGTSGSGQTVSHVF